MAEETGRYTASAISEDQRRFLRNLPLTVERQVDGVRFMLCHAAPGNPLYEYRQQDSELWRQEAAHCSADVLLVGHTHLPFRRPLGNCLLANPGSVGQPKHGAPAACYANWEDGDLRLSSVKYPFEETIAKLCGLPVSPQVRADLALVLRTGSADAETLNW